MCNSSVFLNCVKKLRLSNFIIHRWLCNEHIKKIMGLLIFFSGTPATHASCNAKISWKESTFVIRRILKAVVQENRKINSSFLNAMASSTWKRKKIIKMCFLLAIHKHAMKFNCHGYRTFRTDEARLSGCRPSCTDEATFESSLLAKRKVFLSLKRHGSFTTGRLWNSRKKLSQLLWPAPLKELWW